MSKTGRLLLTTLIGCSFALAGGCGSASVSSHQAKHNSKLVPAPWGQITRGHNSTTLLINETQDTADRRSDCFIRYTSRVIKETSHAVSIELLRPRPPASLRCLAKGVRGPFFVPVHLKRAYRGQRLVDPVTGLAHALARRSEVT